jgi:tetratricopeptide (TPR) repeat protein
MLSLAGSGMADGYLAQGQPEEALKYAEAALSSAEQSGGQLERGVSHRVLGDAWLALSQIGRARLAYEQSIPLLSSAGEPEELANAQRGLMQTQVEQSETS